MPFPSRLLPASLTAQIDNFVARNDLGRLYKGYSWQRDTYNAGFPDILSLENRLTASDLAQGISLEDIRAVARWGAMRNQKRISGPEVCLPPRSLHSANGSPQESLHANPLEPLGILQQRLKGIGPTYQSKVLRFGLPQEFGAIDTRCVRVFGQGDPENQKYDWIELRVRNDGYGWYIPSYQTTWPSGYGLWIDILRYIASILPDNCPHPSSFYHAGLRTPGKWEIADVEMALFTYASTCLSNFNEFKMQRPGADKKDSFFSVPGPAEGGRFRN